MSNIARVPRTEQEAAASYTRLSKWYDRFGGSERPYISEGLRLLNAQPGERALEVGFGTGHGLVALAQAVGSNGRVFGLDLAAGMITVAQTQVHKAQVDDVVTLTCGSALQLPYRDQTLDVVFSSFTLDLIDTPAIPIVLEEMRRVLRPGGRLGLVSMSKACAANAMLKLYEWAHRHWPQLIDCRPIYLRHAVEAASFHCAGQHTRSMWGLPVEIVVATK
jgi:ubiquinone/menaquinone biosynthesis C-methylase UbiE